MFNLVFRLVLFTLNSYLLVLAFILSFLVFNWVILIELEKLLDTRTLTYG